MEDHKITVTPSKNTGIGILAHILGLLTGFLGPLVLYLVIEGDDFGKDQAKEALNFQITVVIAAIVSGILVLLLIGILLLIAVGILNLVFCIIGAVEASQGKYYRYPLFIRFIK